MESPQLGDPLFAEVILPPSAGWQLTGAMAAPRRDHTATRLEDGRVLIIGWFTQDAEIYDPTINTFSSVGATRFSHGWGHSATLLQDGTVLIVGGGQNRRAVELYDPGSGTFATVGETLADRTHHTATRMADGRVLLAGGQGVGPVTHAAVEIYDPSTQSFSPTGSLAEERAAAGAALLADGRVVVVGGIHTTSPGQGYGLRTTELFDPATGTFSPGGSMTVPRSGVETATLFSGDLMVIGGGTQTAEFYDPGTDSFRPTAQMISPHGSGTLTRMHDGRVLVAGGAVAIGPVTTNAAEVYDPQTGQFTSVTGMNEARQQHTATLLDDGRVLVVGGVAGGSGETSTAEFYGLTADQRMRYLASAVDEYVQQEVLNAQQGKQLSARLERSQLRFDAGQYPQAVKQLAGYVRKVESFVRSGVFTPEQAAPLVLNAESLIVQFGG
jgi:hypothetical protein